MSELLDCSAIQILSQETISIFSGKMGDFRIPVFYFYKKENTNMQRVGLLVVTMSLTLCTVRNCLLKTSL